MKVKSIRYRLDMWTQWRDENTYRDAYSIDGVSKRNITPYYDPYIVCDRTADGKVIPLFSSRAGSLYYGVDGRWINF